MEILPYTIEKEQYMLTLDVLGVKNDRGVMKICS